MTTRYWILSGDKTTTGGIVQPHDTPTIGWGSSGQHIALVGDKVICSVCGVTGVIQAVGPRRGFFNSIPYAFHDDICVCLCPVPPKLVNSQTTGSSTFSGEEMAAHASSPAAALPIIAAAAVAAAKSRKPVEKEEKPAKKTKAVSVVILPELHDGSANNGTGSGTQKGLVLGNLYDFEVKEFDNGMPEKESDIRWVVRYTTQYGVQEYKPNVTGRIIRGVSFDNTDLCGRTITIIPYVGDIKDAGQGLKVFVHNHFRWFDAKLVQQQAKERAAEPWRIDQAQTSLCGMAVLFYVMAKLNPSGYVRLVTELHRRGEYTINGYTIKPNVTIRQRMYKLDPASKEFKELSMAQADWIAMAVTRSRESNLGFDGLGVGTASQLKSVNWPSILRELLPKVAGVRIVKDAISSILEIPFQESPLGKWQDKRKHNDLKALEEMEAAYLSGKQVIMMLDGQMLSNKTSYNPMDATENAHWIVYEGGLKFFDVNGQQLPNYSGAATVRFRVYTWGINPLVTNHPKVLTPAHIDISAFESNFYGYFSVV